LKPSRNPTQYASDRLGITHEQLGEALHEINALKALRRELVDPKIAKHHGRIVKTTGDGMLVEFASVVDAVRCAVEVERAACSGCANGVGGIWFGLVNSFPAPGRGTATRQVASVCGRKPMW
jgi:class 3 adenylate cyclase